MGILRLASTDTKRVDLGDGDYLEVRSDLSKRDFNGILKGLPADYDTDKGFSPGQADDFTIALFQTLVVGWSLDVPASVDNYLSLERSAATAVDEALMAQLNSISPDAKERAKSKGDSA
jgi:hypothetical protein